MWSSVPTLPTSGSNAGSSGLETNSACARESRSMKSKSCAVSSVLAATGTTPARMQPRNTTGHSGVSSIATSTRVSGAKPLAAQRVGEAVRLLAQLRRRSGARRSRRR